MSDCTVVVCSCDAYADVWDPFFTLLKKYWPDNPFPIVLNTETKSYSYDGLDIQTFKLYEKEEKVAWSKRLMDHLRKIETKYVLILMEDFFLKDPVDTNLILQTMVWMNRDPEISCFDFYMTTHSKVKCEYPGFMRRPRISQYKFNTEACIWNREHLLSYLREEEDPWVFEFVGNIRSFWTSRKFYVTADGVRPNFNYNTAAVSRGKWNLDAVDQVFKDNGIIIDYSKRGYLSKEEAKGRTVEGNTWKDLGPLRVLHSYIVNIAKHPKSLR